jgi:hypothetical protein
MSFERTLMNTVYQYHVPAVYPGRLLTGQETCQRDNKHDPPLLILREPVINSVVRSTIASRQEGGFL